MKQTTLSFGRVPLAPIDGNRKRKAPEEADNDDLLPLPPAPAAAIPAHWVLEVPKSRWQAAIDRLTLGYRDKSGSSYPAASTNSTNCTLGNKGANRLENGYLQVYVSNLLSCYLVLTDNQIQPVVEERKRAKKGEAKKVKDKPYGAHRVVVLLHHRYDNPLHTSLRTY